MILVISFSRMYHASTTALTLALPWPCRYITRIPRCRPLCTCSRIHDTCQHILCDVSFSDIIRPCTYTHPHLIRCHAAAAPTAMILAITSCRMYHPATSSGQSYTSTHPHLIRSHATAAPTAMILAITSCRMYHTPTSRLSQLPCLGTVACSPIWAGAGVTRCSQHIVQTDISTSYQHKQQDFNEISIISNLLPSLDGRHSLHTHS